MKLKFIIGSGLLSMCMTGSALSADSTVDDNIQYFWDFGDGSTSNEKAPEHVYDKVGLYQAKLMVFQNEKLIDTRVNTIDLVSPLINQIAIDHTLSSLTVSMSAVIDVKQALTLTHHWLVEDQTYVGVNAKHEFSDFGEYKVTLSSYFDDDLVYETQTNILVTEPEPEKNIDDDSSGGTMGAGSLFLLAVMCYRKCKKRLKAESIKCKIAL
ncbi:PKD domain-containing protein [uncultured Shewanella sp.]|uniref:PKD domain-containing protein n=1 Tax=uncultured Shewanella sp. TaxID=173975 RepID=UPI00261FDFF6|nr:PKD domain-containing protein [uncultured Shewanella sp.]